ncbi:MAG: flagellar protein FlaG [Rhodoferax sp.]|nr:flagellar protein FlaG [Rhodoferax sp.]
MTDPVSAPNASPRREPPATVPQVSQLPSQTERVREAAAADREKKTVEASSTQVSSAVAEINQSLQLASIGVQFEFDKEANTMVTQVIDIESGQLIRQMPSEEVVRISKALGKLQGLLVSQKV